MDKEKCQWHDGLTEKQRRFVEAYSSNGGNSTQAALVAGYKHPDPQGARTLGIVRVSRAIEALRITTTNEAIATREERQIAWTAIMRDQNENTKDRLRASEILGRSQGDFIEVVDIKQSIVIERSYGMAH